MPLPYIGNYKGSILSGILFGVIGWWSMVPSRSRLAPGEAFDFGKSSMVFGEDEPLQSRFEVTGSRVDGRSHSAADPAYSTQ